MADQGLGGSSAHPDTRSVFEKLVVILDGAIALQPETESVMRSCLAEGPKNSTLARQAGRLTSTLVDLLVRADALPASAIVEEARGLLLYHHRLLVETVDYAYSVSSVLSPQSAPYFVDHLGEPAVRLRRLRGLVASYLGAGRLPGQLSHSLRTPLTTILGNASSLLQPELDWDRDAEDRLLRGIVGESLRLARAVDNILLLASMSSGTLRPDFDWCEPSAVIRAAVAKVDDGLSPHGRVDVILEPSDIGAPARRLWADHTMLTHAMTNVVDNALRHNPPGTRVTLTAASNADSLTVSLRDDGRGLPAAVGAAVVKAATAGVLPTDVGTGMATTIGLVAVHGGTVAYPPRAIGTCCRMRLPLDVETRGKT
jgi:signal transduction histidine kinase